MQTYNIFLKDLIAEITKLLETNTKNSQSTAYLRKKTDILGIALSSSFIPSRTSPELVKIGESLYLKADNFLSQ